MAKKPSVKTTPSMEAMEAEDDARFAKALQEKYERDVAREAATGVPTAGLPAIVRTNGKVDPVATGKMSANNFDDALREKYGNRESARARAKKNYNVPAQITEEDRQKGRDEIARTKREMTSDSDIPASDKESMSKMIESEEGFKRGGSVRKYAMGGLVRGSVRGGGVALRGLGKGKVY
jgi:hypothetical protein